MTDKKENKSAGFFKALKNGIVERYMIIIVWIAIFIVFSIVSPSFCKWPTITTMLSSKAVVVVLALGLLIPLTANDFNMSGANTLALANMMTAYLTVKAGVPLIISILLALLMGAVVGLINGLLITRLDIDPFIVTMGVGTFLSGVTLWLSTSTIAGTELLPVQNAVQNTRLFDIPLSFFYALILTAILWYFFEYTAAGKKVLYVGRGKNVAKLSGINVNKVRSGAMVASCVISALAGVMFTGTTGSANPTSGLSFQMPAFAAVFLGSTCIKPGRFNPWGCIISVYFLVTGVTGLSILGIDSYIQDIFYGAALVFAVAFSVVIRRRQEKAAKAKNVSISEKSNEKNGLEAEA